MIFFLSFITHLEKTPTPRKNDEKQKTRAYRAGDRGRSRGQSMSHDKPSKPSHHGNLRVALMDAASTIIREENAEGLTLRAVAQAVGVSHAAPYRHFEDKAALVAAVAARGIHHMTRAMQAAIDALDQPTPLARYQAIGVAYVLYAWRHPEYYRVMFDDAVSDPERFPDVHEAKEQCYALLRSAIVDAQAEGTVRQRDPDRFATLSWSLVHGLSALVLSGLASVETEEDVYELARTVTNDAYRGQRASDS